MMRNMWKQKKRNFGNISKNQLVEMGFVKQMKLSALVPLIVVSVTMKLMLLVWSMLAIWRMSVYWCCHLIVVANMQRAMLAYILDSVANRPVLTVSDISRFAEQGGIIELASNNNRIGFRINLRSAKLAGLKIAAPLLRLSDVVKAPVNLDE